MLQNTLVSATNGLKTIKTSRKPGPLDRLGGEFVFSVDEDDEMVCTYAHRMTNTRDHGPLEPVFAAAGVAIQRKTDVTVQDAQEYMSCPL